MAVNSKGFRCGFDSEVITKPELFTFDIGKCFGPNILITGCKSASICVEKCPEKSFHFENCAPETLAQLRADIKCLPEINITDASCETLTQLVKDGQCAEYYFNSYSCKSRLICDYGT